jgi:hypothetical protein
MGVNAMPFNETVQRKKTKGVEQDSDPELTDGRLVVNHYTIW